MNGSERQEKRGCEKTRNPLIYGAPGVSRTRGTRIRKQINQNWQDSDIIKKLINIIILDTIYPVPVYPEKYHKIPLFGGQLLQIYCKHFSNSSIIEARLSGVAFGELLHFS